MVKVLKAKERGVALLVVLLGVALLTLIIVDFCTTAALGYLSAANQANELRAYFLARSGVAVGLGLLAEDSRLDSAMQTPYDSLQDVWAVPFPPVNVDGGTASIAIVDEARKINLNQLINANNGELNPDFALVLQRLFTLVGVDPQIIPAIADWIDADSMPSGEGGAEMDYYMRLMPPYAPRNGPMPTIGDLKMIRGVDDATFNRLLPFVTVEPEMQVNVNTAPPEVLAALSPALFANPDLVKAIVTARMIRPFSNMTDVGNIPGVGQYITDLSKVLTTRSNFFTINGMGTFAGARKLVHSTFRRQPNGVGLLIAWQED
ncbi:MAG TPA: type II secretion system minor pseudopilin GspK [Candidatus Binataceae bacterium]|nr:type II secretion system minor pseudopilin GspK [Candidatus Binataceae bacterium]